MKCPYPAKNQAKGGKSRWKGMTKKQRSEEMKRVRAKGISSANAELIGREASERSIQRLVQPSEKKS